MKPITGFHPTETFTLQDAPSFALRENAAITYFYQSVESRTNEAAIKVRFIALCVPGTAHSAPGYIANSKL